jgi:sugar lactone lactonase YvrE
LLICDLAQGIVWKADPATGRATIFMDTGLGSASGLNALTFDPAGNVYVSDSFQGVIWKTGPTGGTPTNADKEFKIPGNRGGQSKIPDPAAMFPDCPIEFPATS